MNYSKLASWIPGMLTQSGFRVVRVEDDRLAVVGPNSDYVEWIDAEGQTPDLNDMTTSMVVKSILGLRSNSESVMVQLARAASEAKEFIELTELDPEWVYLDDLRIQQAYLTGHLSEIQVLEVEEDDHREQVIWTVSPPGYIGDPPFPLSGTLPYHGGVPFPYKGTLSIVQKVAVVEAAKQLALETWAKYVAYRNSL